MKVSLENLVLEVRYGHWAGDHDDTPLSMIVNTLLVAGEMVYLFSSSSALSGLSMVVCFATKLDYCYHNTEECFTHTDRFLTMCSLKITAHCNDGS